MANALFYLLPEQSQNNPQAHRQLACDIAAEQFRVGRRVWVYCPHREQAEQFDEMLWQRPAEGFVPHNLVGEGPPNGAPVEIGWQAPSYNNRPILINLHPEFPGFCHQFQQIVDFVPADEELKKLARTRYKHYRAAGMALSTQPAPEMNENTNG